MHVIDSVQHQTSQWPDETFNLLRRSGWFPGRTVNDRVAVWAGQFPRMELFPAANRALSEFGAVEVDHSGPGISCAREPFALDPALCIGEEDRFRHAGEMLGQPLYPLGEAVGGHAFLGVAKDGSVHLVMEESRQIGVDIVDALDRLVRGIRSTGPSGS